MSGKIAIVLRHVQFESLGVFESVLKQRNYQIRMIEVGVDTIMEDVLEADLIIVLGGPIGVADVERYPFLAQEYALIERRLTSKKPILGICLGAQLIASVLGANVYAMENKEIGFYPLTLTEAGQNSPLKHMQNQLMVLHWHGDQFDIPQQATRLASSEQCQNQAFAIDKHVLALQFHVEADTDKIEQWLIGHTVELSSSNVNLHTLRKDAERYGSTLKQQGANILHDWLDQLGNLR